MVRTEKAQSAWGISVAIALTMLSLGQRVVASPSEPIRPSIACPTELDELLSLLLRDLPSYANRVIQRSRDRRRSEDISGYVLLASQPDVNLPDEADLPDEAGFTFEREMNSESASALEEDATAAIAFPADSTMDSTMDSTTGSTAGSTTEAPPIFFTTLERQYGISGFAQLQVHHRLFLTPTQLGWQLVLMQSAFQDYPARLPPGPPRDNSHGVVAQAVRLWLRDCSAGAVYGDGERSPFSPPQ
ncbi:MAG: hypothetical protein KME20_02570 [Kaiparowitsia implicata GSE-PSE-MK54-09C]|nr:hypothetical protein [Kaiparowitsia implicata GSE-PSE-MK54-09C]